MLHLTHIWHLLPALAPGMRTFLQYGAAAGGLYYLLYRVVEWKENTDEREGETRRRGERS